MPFLDAKALKTDPDGMAFLRSVISPDLEQKEPASPAHTDLRRRFEVPLEVKSHVPGTTPVAGTPPVSEAAAALT